jgi:hypothetical protein
MPLMHTDTTLVDGPLHANRTDTSLGRSETIGVSAAYSSSPPHASRVHVPTVTKIGLLAFMLNR